jgi:very-short-patch-repair endonuclease
VAPRRRAKRGSGAATLRIFPRWPLARARQRGLRSAAGWGSGEPTGTASAEDDDASEVKVWVRLRELRLLGLHFRRQSPLLNYIVDFECRRARLVVEIDGSQHAMDAGARRDRLRDEKLLGNGYRVLRFWNHEVDENLEGILEALVSAAAARPHPARGFAARHPPLKGEG